MSLLLLFQGAPYHRFLLDTAQRLKDGGDYEPAVVTAQMACEIATEQVLSAAYRHRGIEDLAEPISEFFASFNLGNERLVALYVALTGDQIQETPFWPRFKKHAARRHDVVHGGKRVTKEEAEASIRAATDLVLHLDTVVAKLTE